MFRRAVAIVLAGIALGVGGYAASAASQPFVAAHELCSAGYVSAIIGGQAKCLRAGEFCSPSYEADYEHYGFSCVDGHLKDGAPTTTTAQTTTTSPPTTSAPSTTSSTTTTPGTTSVADHHDGQYGSPSSASAACVRGAHWWNYNGAAVSRTHSSGRPP